MKLRPKTLSISFLMVIILLGGCAGCAQKNALKGIEPADDHNEQSKYGPVAANTRKQAKLKPFLEPSFENLIEQFKADVKANRGDPEVLAHKKQAIKNPNLLWRPSFRVPKKNRQNPRTYPEYNPSADEIRILTHNKKGEPLRARYFDHPGVPNGLEIEFTGKAYYLTKEQEERMKLVLHSDDLPQDERQRKYYKIMFEGINTFTAAKYLSKETSSIAETIGLEYAERAMREHPNSLEAMHLWAKCVPWEPIENKRDAYEKLLTKFPNDASAHSILGFIYWSRLDSPELAIPHYQKSIQLDSRGEAGKKHWLAFCYEKLGEYEKAVAVYQSISVVDTYGPRGYMIPMSLNYVQDVVYKQRTGRSFYDLDD